VPTEAVSRLSASQEDYLEAIYGIVQDKRVARSRDIAERLGVHKSTVTGALRALSERGLVHYEPYGHVTLTDRGRETARAVVRRHEVLRDFFTDILLAEAEDAETAACRLEHGIPPAILEKLVDLASFMKVCPRFGEEWRRRFQSYCTQQAGAPPCEECLSETAERVVADLRGAHHRAHVPLNELGEGEQGRLVGVPDDGPAAELLRKRGIHLGMPLEIESLTPDGGARIKARGFHFSLAPDDLLHIAVEPL